MAHRPPPLGHVAGDAHGTEFHAGVRKEQLHIKDRGRTREHGHEGNAWMKITPLREHRNRLGHFRSRPDLHAAGRQSFNLVNQQGGAAGVGHPQFPKQLVARSLPDHHVNLRFDALACEPPYHTREERRRAGKSQPEPVAELLPDGRWLHSLSRFRPVPCRRGASRGRPCGRGADAFPLHDALAVASRGCRPRADTELLFRDWRDYAPQVET